ncbi:MAG: heparinase II/III family protein, partial [Syntrophobacteraceae bacterium]
DLLWFEADGQDPGLSGVPKDNYFRGVETVTFRSRWNDPNAFFIGFKGGDSNAGHSHLDLGSFVLGAQGIRWAVDLGADDYDLPGYFEENRWDYYRRRAEGHNTLVINPDKNPDQDPKAKASMIRFRSTPDLSFAIVDLSAAYARGAKKALRGVALLKQQQVLVQDEIQSDSPADLWWAMHTKAEVQISGDKRSAVLTQGSSRLVARIIAPSEASFASLSAQPSATSPHPLNQATNSGITKLSIHMVHVQNSRLVVLLEPLYSEQTDPLPPPPISPLADWQ